MTRILLSTILLVSACAGATASSVVSNPLQRAAALQRFESVAGAQPRVRWSPVDDVPVSVRAVDGQALAGFSIDPAVAVQALFREHADLFRLRPGTDAFRSGGERQRGGIHHLRMIQTFHGIPVRGGQYMVSVGSDGRLRMLAGRSVPDVDADTEPLVTESRAIAAAASSRGLASTEGPSATLAIEPAEGRDHLVWEVRVGGPGRAGEWEVLVDARSGSIAGSRSRAFGASGCATVFPTSPDHPMEEGSFVINDPQPDSAAFLEGPQIHLFHDTAPEATADSLVGGCFDFHFDPDTDAVSFDQVNVYWTLDHFLRVFQGGNGFSGLSQPLTAVVHAYQCREPASGEVIGNILWITSAGCGYRSSTRDADIIDHEAQHVVNNSFGLEGGTDLNREIYATAIHEALATYFACAAHDDPVYGEYFFGPEGFANCNSSPDEYNYSRRLEIGIGTLQNYLLGMIWSGALWDIRTAIGPIADRIVLASLAYLPSTPSMHDGVDAILQADRDHFEGVHLTAIGNAFHARGLNPTVLEASIAGPFAQASGIPATWVATACCGGAPYAVQWSVVAYGDTTPVPVGTRDTVTIVRETGYKLRLKVTDSWGRVGEESRFIGIVPLAVTIEGPRQVNAISTEWRARLTWEGWTPSRYRWVRSCLDDTCAGDTIGALRVLTARLARSSRLRVIVDVEGRVLSDEIRISVDAPPRASIVSAPDELGPGQTGTLTGEATGGLAPYQWRWTRDLPDIGPFLGSTQTIAVTGDYNGFDVYLRVTSALGLLSEPVRHTIAPKNVPIVANVLGPEQIPAGLPRSWYVQFPDGPPPTATTYRWTRACRDPDCAPEYVGDGNSVLLSSLRNFDLTLVVTSGVRTTTVTRRISVEGVPAARVEGPERLSLTEPATLRAVVTGGRGPYTYRWSRDGVSPGQVLGTGSSLTVRGDGHELLLYLTVTSADGLRSDAAFHRIEPRSISDRPAFLIEDPLARDGAPLMFLLAGAPGSNARLTIHDVAGRQVASIFNGTLEAGIEFIGWSSAPLGSGVYLAAAEIGGERIVRRFTVLH